jgi:hypothetical protein
MTPDLSADDQRVVDALVEHGFDAGALGAAHDRRRLEAVQQTFALLDRCPVDDAEDALLHATLARIDRHEELRAERMTLAREEAAGAGRTRLFRTPDLISVAAVMLIAASVAWPLLNTLRQRSIDDGCASNLAMIGQAFTTYAASHDGSLPVRHVAAGLGGWDGARNHENLLPLVEQGYCEHGCLNCPGGAHRPGPSYSYQLQVPGLRGTWGLGMTAVLLSDRNPLIDAYRAGQSAAPMSISLNHGLRGQNAIRDDGSIAWLTVPRVGADCIWLPNGAKLLRRGDLPRDASDVFLTH